MNDLRLENAASFDLISWSMNSCGTFADEQLTYATNVKHISLDLELDDDEIVISQESLLANELSLKVSSVDETKLTAKGITFFDSELTHQFEVEI